MNFTLPLFAPVPKGMESLLSDELKSLGASEVVPARAGVSFQGDQEVAYRACLWSRTASRVLISLASFEADSPDTLYAGIRALPWEEHLAPEGTLAVDFSESHSPISHTHFGALKVKDAIVDRLRTPSGMRPNIDLEDPDVRINVHMSGTKVLVSLDLSGGGLHRRGYRAEARLAPLKENLASAILLLSEWPRIASEKGGFVDPMSGSGTLVIEAAAMAAGMAPGLLRPRFGFERWRGHQPALWAKLRSEAGERDRRAEKPNCGPIVGYDEAPGAIRNALENARSAGVEKWVHFERRELERADPVGDAPGIVVVNPPYGERLGEEESLRFLYRRLGDTLKQRFEGWTANVFTGNPELAKSLGLSIERRFPLFNGPIDCRLLRIPLYAGSRKSAPEKSEASPAPEALNWVEPFANRLEKNWGRLSKWAQREGITCFRVYDADLPEFALAIDWYEGVAHVQEYKAPASVDPLKAERRLHAALSAIPKVLGISQSQVFLKVRQRQKGASQYERLSEQRSFREVHEGGHRFWVNLTDYLDTGLFLDHRKMRALVGELAPGRDFLNLFAYTGTATVYAAKGGARSTTTVDLSNTYLDWAGENFHLNKLAPRDNRVVRADCLAWLDEAVQESKRYGLIFLDVPTFSTSKGMEQSFDVQRDQVALIEKTMRLLERGGILLFSNNNRRFKLDPALLERFQIEDLTRKTLPYDFERNPRIHSAFKISQKNAPPC